MLFPIDSRKKAFLVTLTCGVVRGEKSLLSFWVTGCIPYCVRGVRVMIHLVW